MSTKGGQLGYVLAIAGFVVFYGIASLVIGLVGYGNLYSSTYYIVAFALLALTLPFALIISYLVSRRGRKKGAAATPDSADQIAPASQSVNLKSPAGGFDEITKGIEETVQFLKSSNVDIYSLPWYVVAGLPRSGKSSLVLASNLNFQTLPSQRESEQKFIRPTRAVDWRVTNDAVFLDTAGRYQTEGPDGDEWSALLEAVKKYRPQRPIDGMILAVDPIKILNGDEKESEEAAKILRARIDEAALRTKNRFPIYLVFTHADKMEGFADSFSTSQREGQNLVWGATIPIEKSDAAQSLFDIEFNLLQQGTMKRRLIRLSAPFPPVRQLRIFNFPLHFGAARRKLGHFVSTLFRPNPFSESPFLRGFYFTAIPSSKGQAPQTVGTSFFTQKLFREVVLRDKDMVATFQAQRQKPPILGWLATLTGAAIVFLLLGLSAYSLYKNKQMLDDASTNGEALMTIAKADAGRDPLTKTPDEARRELDATDELRRTLLDLDNYDRNGAPYLMRMGLYSGGRIYHEMLLPTYFNVVEHRFKEPARKKLEDALRKFSTSAPVANPTQMTAQEEENLGKNYDLLKTYLMLSGDFRDKAEPTSIATTLAEFWKSESKLPAGSDLVAQQQLEFWAKQVDRDEFPRIKLDNNLIDAARKKLQSFPAVYRYYKRKVTEISKEVDGKLGATTVEGVLTSNGGDTSFTDGSYQVPGAYTLEGYRLMKKAISASEKELSADDWVMGEPDKKVVAQTTDASKLEERYFRDYADHWKNFVKAVSVRPYKKEDAARALQAFSSANSPIEILMKEVARNTNLSAKPKNQGWWDWIKSFFVSKESTDTGGNTQVEKEFRPLFTFVGDDAKTTDPPIGKYRSEISKVYTKVNGLSVDELNQISKDLAQDKDQKLQLRNSETAVASLLAAFTGTPSGQEMADLLKKPLGNLRSLLGADAQSQLGKTWANEVLPKAREAEKGFPFDDTGEADLTKLSAYLNPVNGTLSDFYEKNLKKYFEESGGQLKVKESSPVKFTDEFVTYLNNAFKLRDTLYGKSATPAFSYDFKMQKVPDALIEVTIDGQKIDSNGTGSTNFKFPAASGETGAFMNFASTAESTPTSGKTPSPANSANSNVNTSSNANVKKFFQTSNTNTAAGNDQKKFPGTWGLFKFFDAGQPQKQSSGEYSLTYKLGGKTVSATVKPSGGDLFDKTMFRNVHAPDKLLR
jgi:type VI secretion system protein ImpL